MAWDRQRFAWRRAFPGVETAGLEIQPDYARLARENAALNAASLQVHAGDVTAMPSALKAMVFDGVMLNPPWWPSSETASPDRGRDTARRTGLAMSAWIYAALARTRPGGYIVIIQRAERLAAMLAPLTGPAGAIAVLPLAARIGRDAKRVIVRARKGSRAPLRIAPPLVLHDGAAHDRDGDDHSERAAAGPERRRRPGFLKGPFMQPIPNSIAAMAGEMTEWRRDFHQHPELSQEEERTAGIVAGKLRSWGFDAVEERIGGHGVVGVLHGRNGPGDAILLRADMDALPMPEETGLDHASQNPRRDACLRA